MKTMTPSRASSIANMLSAFAAGKTVQWQNMNGDWLDYNPDIHEFFHCHEWRIKPAATLRPWRPEKVPSGAKFHIKGATCWGTVMEACFKYVVFWSHPRKDTIEVSYSKLCDDYEHSLDNGLSWKPCGILVD